MPAGVTKSSAEKSADELVQALRTAQNIGTKEWTEDYIYAKIWRNVLSLANCDPEKVSLLTEFKCEIRSLLLIAQEMKIDLSDAAKVSRELKRQNKGGQDARG